MILEKSARYIANAVKKGEIKAVDVANAFIDHYKKTENKVNAFNSIDFDDILKRAQEVDIKRSKGIELGDLAGVPFVIKDNILVKDQPMSCSSKMLEGYKAIYDAFVVEKIVEADGIPFGKSNLDEFAMGSSTENSATKLSLNPWDLSRVPGGSSGGSAAAVSSLMAPLALGSDTGGSVRQPASFCGLSGLKPTYGRVSRRGIVSFASSLDQIGPFARDIEDIALSMNVLAGYDEKDTTSLNVEVDNYLSYLDKDIKGMKIGILNSSRMKGVDKDILNNFNHTKNVLKDLGAEIVDLNLSAIDHAIEAYYIIAPSEVSSNLSRIDGLKYGLSKKDSNSIDEIYLNSRSEGFGEEVKRRVMIGNYVLSAGYYDSYHEKAYKVRRVVKNQFDSAFEKVDVILMPTTPTTAFKIGENTSDPVKMYLSDIFTTPANLAGVPAISFLSGFSDGLPIGMQLIGKYFGEGDLIRVVSAFNKSLGDISFRREYV